MRIGYSKRFLKQLRKSPQKVQRSFYARLEIFIEDPANRILRHHALSGELRGLYTINITGDWRAVYETHNDDVVFVMIGTHSQLYR